MIITIDGPAGAGKSTLAKLLAQRIGFEFLDTGAMYRAATVAVQENEVDLHKRDQVTTLMDQITIDFDNDKVLLNERDVTRLIRTPEITQGVSAVADHPDIRNKLVQLQRDIADNGKYVCEGRDQGTVAFPDAPVKFFLTASPEERAKRRWIELRGQGIKIEYDEVLQQQNRRDELDQSRKNGPLVAASDAVKIDTDHLTLVDVLEKMTEIIQQRIGTE